MEIKKRLTINGKSEISAVLLNDEGEEYPVFLESLHNTVIFPTLLKSGYGLTGLPYGFVKNGVTFDSLPVENYNCTKEEEERMHYSIGRMLPIDELKSHILVEEATGLPTPPTNYTIFTREDLLKYLDALSIANLEDDFMPLNYFVAPEARFTIKEYKDIANLKYIQLINSRRDMSLKKFHKLIEALQKINLNANPSPMAVLNAYFAWGVDGLNFKIINMHTESRAFRLTANRNVNAPMSNKTYGLVDGMGNLLTPINQRNMIWKLTNKDPNFVSEITSGMQADDTRVVEFTSTAKQEVTTLEGVEFNVQYTEEMLLMQLQTYPAIRVQSPVRLGEYIELKYAMPNNKDMLYEYCTMDALAQMLYEYRKPTVRVSSYDALKIAGCNPKTVFDYIITKYNMSKETVTLTDDAAPQIFDFDIDNYVAGNTVADDVRAFLDDIYNGVFNIDKIAAGKSIEASVNITNTFKEIYAIHNVMGIALKDIYEKFKSVTPDVRTLTFSNGELNYTMDVSPMNFSINGYKEDIMAYDLDNAKNCTFFTYVTMVAREVGDEAANRHVGMEFYIVNKKYKDVQDVLYELEKSYESKVYTNIPDVTKQAGAMRLVHMFALSRFFEIAFKGTVTYPNNLGGMIEPALPSTIAVCRKRLERKIENITAYCSYTTYTANAQQLSFNSYCTNAYVTPEYVIPRSNTPIHEVPFYAAWVNWKGQNPGIWQQLVERNVILADFEAWELRYADEQFVQRDLFDLDNADSLLHYYNAAIEEVEKYPNDIEFASVTHPIEYMFPGIEVSEKDELPKLPVPRQGAPVIRLGLCRDITINDYKDKLFPSEVVKQDSYIRPYRGFTADVFMTVNDAFSKIPSDAKKSIVVMARAESLFIQDLNQVMNYRRIVELDMEAYGIVHVYDRNYLFRAADGKLWEVRI